MMTLSERRRKLEEIYNETIDIVLYYNASGELEHLYIPDKVLDDVVSDSIHYCTFNINASDFKKALRKVYGADFIQIFIMRDGMISRFIPEYLISALEEVAM